MRKKIVRLLGVFVLLCVLLTSCSIYDKGNTTDIAGNFTYETNGRINTTEKVTRPENETHPGNETQPEKETRSEGTTDDGSWKLPDEAPKPDSDPYQNVDIDDFYRNYEPAESYWDAYYRTKHFLMSGSISEQPQEPTLAAERPQKNGTFLRNTSAVYSDDGNVYYIVDADGKIVNRVYFGAAYVTLEEVAAYVFAFGDVPPNYVNGKKTKPQNSNWGEYLRLNHSEFSGDTSRYPYEPVLPRISGCGGDLYYYEIDIGTTGTDCDPAYIAAPYNDGKRITRGAARIVYTRYDANGDNIIDVNEKFLFYTYNHYNDFQEYLNYEGGWGEMFGNITGGGKISSKTEYNPTRYVETERVAFVPEYSRNVAYVDILFLERRYFVNAA